MYHLDAWAHNEFGAAALGDVRRTERLVQLASVLGANRVPRCPRPATTRPP